MTGFTTAPVPAIRVLNKAGMAGGRRLTCSRSTEAFAVVAMIAARDLPFPTTMELNGATALSLSRAGRARILATLIAALENRGGKARRRVAVYRWGRNSGDGDRTRLTVIR